MNVPSLARDKESSIEAEKPEFYAGKGRGIIKSGIIGIYTCVSNKVSLPRKVKKKKEKKKERTIGTLGTISRIILSKMDERVCLRL